MNNRIVASRGWPVEISEPPALAMSEFRDRDYRV